MLLGVRTGWKRKSRERRQTCGGVDSGGSGRCCGGAICVLDRIPRPPCNSFEV